MEVRGSMWRWWRREKVPKSKSPKVKGSEGPSYLKVTFKYELDSKEGPSCYQYNTQRPFPYFLWVILIPSYRNIKQVQRSFMI